MLPKPMISWTACALKRAGSLVLLAALAGCGRPTQFSADRYGMIEGVRLRSLVHQAIEGTDHYLEGEVKFAVSWNCPPDRIPVFILAGAGPLAIWVPNGYRVVLLQEENLERFLTYYVGPMSEEQSSWQAMLTLMLLHEAGHLVHGDAGAYDVTGVQTTGYNRDDTAQKRAEVRADDFAVDAIVKLRDAGSTRAMMLEVHLMSFGYNLLKERLIDNFGATGLRAPSAFWDGSDTHPNLELRILTMLARLSPQMYEAQLDDFIERRRSNPNPVLYQADDLPP